MVALGLWASAAAATAKHLKLAPRARAAQLLLAAVTLTAALAIVSANIIWLAAIQSSLPWLVVGVANLAWWASTCRGGSGGPSARADACGPPPAGDDD